MNDKRLFIRLCACFSSAVIITLFLLILKPFGQDDYKSLRSEQTSSFIEDGFSLNEESYSDGFHSVSSQKDDSVMTLSEGVADYWTFDPGDYYLCSDYVFLGEVLRIEEEKTHAIPNDGRPESVALVQVLDVYKGNPGEELEFCYPGGIITNDEHLANMYFPDEATKEEFFKLYESDPSIEKKEYVELTTVVARKVVPGKKYVFFLCEGKGALDPYLYLFGGAYSLFEVDDLDRAYIPFYEKYEYLNDLKSFFRQKEEETTSK